MEKKTLMWILVFAVLIVLFSLLLIFYSLSKPVDSYVLESHVVVDESIGFNLDADKLYFGRVTPGGNADRSIRFSSPNEVLLTIVVEGETSSWISLPESPFVLEANENLSLSFSIEIPEGTPLGNYTNNVIFTFYRPFMKRFI